MTTSADNVQVLRAPRGRAATTPLERCEGGEPLHDYVLAPYAPLAPMQGKLRSVNVLYEAFAVCGIEPEGHALVEQIRRGLGPHRTVWGVKHRRGEASPASFELYFYDFQRTHADLSLERMKTIVADSLVIDAEEPWPLPWHMFSVEFTPEQLRARAAVPADVYVDLRSYKVRGREYVLENIYTFHDPRLQIDEILHRLKSSVHFNVRDDNIARLMPPSMFRCHKVCVAHKRTADAMYFSRVPTLPTLSYLRDLGFPEPLTAWLHDRRDALDHLNWDIGVDFDRRDGVTDVRRIGLYGSF